jgi:hypothetical protein
MLTTQQLEANKQKFIDTNNKYEIFTPELLDFLGDGFYISPASPTLEMYGCFPGGLLNHLIKACKYAVQINDLLPETIKQNKESIIKCAFLSQIGKVFLFKPNPREWHRKNLGKMYEFTDDLVSLKTGERSVYYAINHGVKLKENEFQAIVNLDKDETDKQAKYYSEALTNIVKQGIELAIIDEKEHGKRRD